MMKICNKKIYKLATNSFSVFQQRLLFVTITTTTKNKLAEISKSIKIDFPSLRGARKNARDLDGLD